MTLLNALKTIICLTIILYAAPFLIEGIKKQYIPLLEPQTHIGVLQIKEPLNNADYLTKQLHSFFADSVSQPLRACGSRDNRSPQPFDFSDRQMLAVDRSCSA